MKCKREFYRGIEIDHNVNTEFGSKYLSLVNTGITLHNNRNPHVHTSSLHSAHEIIDAYHDLNMYGYTKHQRNIKNKAMCLMNLKVLSK